MTDWDAIIIGGGRRGLQRDCTSAGAAGERCSSKKRASAGTS